MGDVEVVADFLPSPADLAFKEDGAKVTLAMSKSSMDFFKSEASKCCMMEARLESRQPVAVTEQAPVMAQAVQGAAQKLAHLLSSALGRLHDHKEKTSGLPLSGTE